ncbi:lysozyme family protein [Lactococcus fujiensis]|uniref:Soluble lytic murein transglycosylase n=1 Tax=Lactococcus fujiensis JCM 16395 TaxID=1291764 RepID=A0A2A5RP92_9LACT|nr:lysozyme family protein [Lactococcus fujiensis]PCS01248.1 soluble lytic murein transglycosylase [Lactococcus fujiensis JCM 16395]
MLKKFVKLIVLVLIVLAGFYVYRIHENVKHVMTYKSAVEASLKKQGLQGDTNLALAIIYTETKGKSTDIMQSSESLTGQKDTIGTESESIQQGLLNLTKVLQYAADKNVDVWAGVQAYNYGKNYIDYIAENGGKNTLTLSKSYSRDVVAPSLGNSTGATYYHITLDSLWYNQGKLYVNGGNMFYAREVRMNMYLLRYLNW